MPKPDAVAILSPTGGASLGTTFTVSGTATSPTNTVYIAVLSNGSNVANSGAVAVTNGNWTYTFSSIAPCNNVNISAYYSSIGNAFTIFGLTIS